MSINWKGKNMLSISLALLTSLTVILAFCFKCSKWYSIIPVVLVDAYLMAALFTAARRSDKDNKFYKDCILPTNAVGLFVLIGFVIVIVTAFANIYVKISSSPPLQINNTSTLQKDTSQLQSDDKSFSPLLASRYNAFYFSVLTATTVGYGDITPKSDPAKFYVVFEILSSFLLFFAAFPLLISRMSDFKEPPYTENGGAKTKVEISTADSKIVITKIKTNDPVEIKVDDKPWSEKA